MHRPRRSSDAHGAHGHAQHADKRSRRAYGGPSIARVGRPRCPLHALIRTRRTLPRVARTAVQDEAQDHDQSRNTTRKRALRPCGSRPLSEENSGVSEGVRMLAGRVCGMRTSVGAMKHPGTAPSTRAAPSLRSSCCRGPCCSSCCQRGRNRHTCEEGRGKGARAGRAAHAEPRWQLDFPRCAGHCHPWPVA